MGRHRRDELETQTSPDDDQLAAAWKLHFPLDLMNPAVSSSPAKEWPEVDTSTYPIRFLDTLKLTLESWAFNFTKGEAVTRYADVTDSGLPASDTAPHRYWSPCPQRRVGRSLYWPRWQSTRYTRVRTTCNCWCVKGSVPWKMEPCPHSCITP